MADLRAASSRFIRPKAKPHIVPTDDDLALLLHIYRHRIIDADDIRSLFPKRSSQGLTRRLEKLFKARFIDRVKRIKHRAEGGSYPIVYALDREGAALLRAKCDLNVSKYRWPQKNRELQWTSIEHSLDTTRFVVKLEVAARKREGVKLEYLDEILEHYAPKKLERSYIPTTLRPSMDWNGYHDREGTKPDQIVLIHDRSAPEGKQKRFLLLEIDRGTETIEPTKRVLDNPRTFFRGSSLLRKFIVYQRAFRHGTHAKVLGIPAFQVLTVTNKLGRVREMQKMYQNHLTKGVHAIGPGFFLFTDWETISRHRGDLLSLPVQNADGKIIWFS